jgi:RimJ/RimL family protein N-acetyltransferase
MNYIMETERLMLREFRNSDAKFIIELLNSPGWLDFIGNRNVHTTEEAINYMENGSITKNRFKGFGLSLVENKKDKLAIGMCGLVKRDYMEHPDLGFAFLPDAMKKGYAFEIAEATLRYCREALNIQQVCAITSPENKRSIRLLEKLGMFTNQTIKSPDNEMLMLFY